MPPAYPNDFTQEIERRWQRRSLDPLPTPQNDNASSGGRCPTCDGPSLLVPLGSEHRVPGLVRDYWRCSSCGRGWAAPSSNL